MIKGLTLGRGLPGASPMTMVQEKVNEGRNGGQIPSIYNNQLYSNGRQKGLMKA